MTVRVLKRAEGQLARHSETPWWASGLLAVGLLAVADTVMGEDDNLSATFTIAPFIAATGANPRQTASVGLVASAASVVFSLHDRVSVSGALARAAVVVLGSSLAVLAAHRRTARERRLSAVTRVAEVAQQAILAPIPARLGPFALASAYVSATEEARLGGDFYEVVESRHGIRLILGDVRGKGVEAVRLAALVIRYFRDAALTSQTMEAAALAMDRSLRGHMGPEEFVTALCVQLEEGAIEVVNCGHHPPAFVAPVFRLVDEVESTTPLGLDPRPTAARVPLSPGDRLLLYTDGLVEARHADGSFVDLEDLASDLVSGDLSSALFELMARLHSLVGDQLGDDLAALLIEYAGRGARRPSPAPAAPVTARPPP